MPDWRFWLALPGLLPQALRLRAGALRLPPAAGQTQGQVAGSGPPLRLLLLGDSIIAGIGVAKLEDAFAGQLAKALARHSGRAVEWQAIGQGGLNAAQVAAQLLPRLQPVIDVDQPDGNAVDQAPVTRRFDLACISVGVNDITGLTARPRWRAALQRLHAGLAMHAERSLHLGLPPLDRFPLLPSPLQRSFGRRGRMLDALAAEIASGPDRLHLPMAALPEPDQFAADGFHPNGEACAVWANDVADRLLSRWPELRASTAPVSCCDRRRPDRNRSPLR